ncbi:hypothetical protein DL546_007844 [Coniochaeta pulveracea]|uniref:Uncharacterized protein n=1 Tax=Coniochaeta pulveracea TaxID=177199 RepID=A0A420YJI9_9PEZI|nr:hypothetical protein DL546_007844 [Coniochaeta pulveracea]
MFRDESARVIKNVEAKARRRALGSKKSNPAPNSKLSPSPMIFETRGKSLTLLTPKSTRAPSSTVEAPPNWTTDDTDLLPSPDSGSFPSTPLTAMLYNLNPTLQERGTALFFARYVVTNENWCHQRFDFVRDVWKPASMQPERQVDGVMASMTALGLISWAHSTGCGETWEAARKSYCTALRLTTEALQNPVEAVKDTTMLAILILICFSMMDATTPETVHAWRGHIDGAIAIAEMRGVSQFQTHGGIGMFKMLCQLVMISCIQRQLPMPQSLIDLRNELAKVQMIQDPTWQMSESIYKILQARYDITRGFITEPRAIVNCLLAIEYDFETMLATLPQQWNYRTISVNKRHPGIYQRLCHVYPSTSVASIWNSVRACRMLILETLVSQLQLLFDQGLATSQDNEEYVKSVQVLRTLRDGIIASVPHHNGLVTPHGNGSARSSISSVTVRDTPSPPAVSPPSVSSPGSTAGRRISSGAGPTVLDPLKAVDDPDEEARRFMLLASSTNTIIWPLFVVGMSSVCTPEMKTYVVERLQAICAETGDRAADAVAGMIEEHELGVEWPDAGFRSRYNASPSDVALKGT